jgi:hypothetical protein
MAAAAHLLFPPNRVYADKWEEEMTLIIALLRKNFIVVAGDRRHTRGDNDGNYAYDGDVKIWPILNGYGLIAFAGHDLTEQIYLRAQDKGILSSPDLRRSADELSRLAIDVCQEAVPHWQRHLTRGSAPSVQFLLTGFVTQPSGVEARSYMLSTGRLNPFYPMLMTSAGRGFEVIGKSKHGALYALHRFNEQATNLESAKRLSIFALREICKSDTSVGGLPLLWVIEPGAKAVCLEDTEMSDLVSKADEIGESVAQRVANG